MPPSKVLILSSKNFYELCFTSGFSFEWSPSPATGADRFIHKEPRGGETHFWNVDLRNRHRNNLGPVYFSNACLVVALFDATKPTQFEQLQLWIQTFLVVCGSKSRPPLLLVPFYPTLTLPRLAVCQSHLHNYARKIGLTKVMHISEHFLITDVQKLLSQIHSVRVNRKPTWKRLAFRLKRLCHTKHLLRPHYSQISCECKESCPKRLDRLDSP